MDFVGRVQGLSTVCPKCHRQIEVHHYGDEGGGVSYCCDYEFHSELSYSVEILKRHDGDGESK